MRDSQALISGLVWRGRGTGRAYITSIHKGKAHSPPHTTHMHIPANSDTYPLGKTGDGAKAIPVPSPYIIPSRKKKRKDGDRERGHRKRKPGKQTVEFLCVCICVCELIIGNPWEGKKNGSTGMLPHTPKGSADRPLPYADHRSLFCSRKKGPQSAKGRESEREVSRSLLRPKGMRGRGGPQFAVLSSL